MPDDNKESNGNTAEHRFLREIAGRQENRLNSLESKFDNEFKAVYQRIETSNEKIFNILGKIQVELGELRGGSRRGTDMFSRLLAVSALVVTGIGVLIMFLESIHKG